MRDLRDVRILRGRLRRNRIESSNTSSPGGHSRWLILLLADFPCPSRFHARARNQGAGFTDCLGSPEKSFGTPALRVPITVEFTASSLLAEPSTHFPLPAPQWRKRKLPVLFTDVCRHRILY